MTKQIKGGANMCPIPYYTMLRKSKDKSFIRHEMVIYAKEHGKKPAAVIFKATVKTVKKWFSRFEEKGYEGLKDLSKAPKNIPHKTPKDIEDRIIAIKKDLPTWGALRIKRDFNIPRSDKTIARIIKSHGITRKRKKKYVVKNDLRAMKSLWNIFSRSNLDTKDLIDIPEYYLPMKLLKLYPIQYTLREPVTGLQFLGFGDERSLVNSTIFIDVVLSKLRECNVDLTKLTVQTDNGSEFIGSYLAKKDSSFTFTVSKFGAEHFTIPPRAHTWQADVETVHNLIENEFFRIESFISKNDFKIKATVYQLFFNTVRKNYYKGGLTPLDILKQRNLNISQKVCLIPPIFLDDEFKKRYINKTDYSKRGYHVPTFAF
ncbi:MAG: helix-turn-helix domain-containing protein [Candidatus Firestonebacteria bacterium]